MVVVLYHAAYRYVDMELLQNAQRNVHLPLAAVHHDNVRKFRKAPELLIQILILQLPLLLHSVQESPGKNLLHAGVVVRPRHGFDPEFPVIAALWFPLLIDHHGTHIRKTADIGNIVGLHPVYVFQSEQLSNLLSGAYGSSFLPSDPLLVLFQDKPCVFGGKLHQLFLGADLRHLDVDPASPPPGKPLFQNLRIVNLLLEHQLPGDKRRSRIKLLHKVQKDLGPWRLRHMGHIKMLPSHELASPDKEHLHHRVPVVAGQGYDILVLPVAVRDLLLLGNLLYAVIKIAVTNRLLVFHFIGRLLHLLLQLPQNLLVASVQKIKGSFHLLPVDILGNVSLAGRRALPDVIIQARPVVSAVPWKIPVTGPKLV